MLKANKKNDEILILLNDFYEHYKSLANDDNDHAEENIVYEGSLDTIHILHNPITEHKVKRVRVN